MKGKGSDFMSGLNAESIKLLTAFDIQITNLREFLTDF